MSQIVFDGVFARVARLAAAASIVTGLVAAGGCSPNQAQQPPPSGPMPVEIQTLTERPVEQTSEFVGTVKSRRSTTVQAQVEGFVTKVHAKSGDRVTAGTVLFEIDDRSQLAVVAGLESVRAARESDAAYARQQAERAKRLLAAGAMSQQEFDQAQALLRSAEAQLKVVEEQIRQQKNEWQYTRVVAGGDGIVGDVPVRVGERITRATPLTTIEDNSAMELYLNVPVQESPRLRVGLPVHLLNDTGGTLSAERISFVSPSVDDSTQTVLVKTSISSRPGLLRSDQFVRARVIWSTNPTLTIPLVSVIRVGPQYFAFAAEPGEGGALVARQKAVTLGPLVDNDYVLLGGLKAGDKLIVGGIQKIRDGVPVMAAPPGGPPKPADPAGGLAAPKPAQPAKAGQK